MAPKEKKKKVMVLGQDWDAICAVIANLVSWFVHRCCPSLLPRLLPTIAVQDTSQSALDILQQQQQKMSKTTPTVCVAIGRPGGKEQLRLLTLRPGYVTAGYNLGFDSPFVDTTKTLPPNTVVIRNHAFSINYADCAIRWGPVSYTHLTLPTKA